MQDSAVPEPSPAAPVAVEPLSSIQKYLADYNCTMLEVDLFLTRPASKPLLP